jgi:hypothetical protein
LSQPFWPFDAGAQSDYEALRKAVLAGERMHSLAAARFARRGLAGLIDWPAAEPEFTAVILGAQRPAWTPYVDPRLEALAASYELLLRAPADGAVARRMQR